MQQTVAVVGQAPLIHTDTQTIGSSIGKRAAGQSAAGHTFH